MFNDVISVVFYAGCAMRGEILGVERRRFWHDDDKLEIVVSVGVSGANVTQVAQRHEIRRQRIFAWRHDLKRKGLWSPDAGALVPHHPATLTPSPTAVELRFIRSNPPLELLSSIAKTTSDGYTLVADPSTLDDADGLSTVSFQWTRGGSLANRAANSCTQPSVAS